MTIEDQERLAPTPEDHRKGFDLILALLKRAATLNRELQNATLDAPTLKFKREELDHLLRPYED